MTLVDKLRTKIAKKNKTIKELRGCLDMIWERDLAIQEMEERRERRRVRDHEREMALRSLGWW